MILVTGCAGFIGMHTALYLLKRGEQVVGIDNLNDYYDVSLKQARLKRLFAHSEFRFIREDIAERQAIERLFVEYKPHKVVHLAAQAGVRYSLENPHAYVDSNLQGFINILEGCRHQQVKHLVYASSSSVYGSNSSLPFHESQNIDHPLSLYAATKKANELMAHTYSHLYDLPTTGLRFFTVYGPWGRPDMALFKFTKLMLEGKPIEIFNNGQMIRDFTYIDDIVEGIVRVMDKPAMAHESFSTKDPNPAISDSPYRVFNIGNNNPTLLAEYISALESALGIEAKKNYLPMQPGDVPATAADTELLATWVGFKPDTSINIGIQNFVNWYQQYFSEQVLDLKESL